MSDGPTRPRPKFGWHGQSSSTSMPEDYYVDFSYVHMPYPHGDDWKWYFNIPLGSSIGINTELVKKIVWNLQRKHGCANVASGSANPLGPYLGVYVGPRHGQHRTEVDCGGKPMCRCFG